MALGSLLERLFVQITGDASGFAKAADSVSRDVSKLSEDIGRRMTSVGNTMAGVGAGMSAAITTPLIAIGKASVDTARDFQEMQSAFGYTFKSMADSVRTWAEAHGNAVGRATGDMQQYAMTAMQLFSQAAPTQQQAAELSKTFAQLAVDLGSFYNVADEDAMQALRAGLTGESEPLRRFGIFLNEAAVKAKALEMGLKPVGKELTDQQKIMARAQLIMEATKDAQGDAARTAGSLANQQRAASAAFEEMRVTIGTAFIPIMTQVTSILGSVVNAFNQLGPGAQQAVLVIGGIAAAAGPVLGALGLMVSGIGTLIGSAGFAGFIAIAAPVAAAVAAIVGAFLVFKSDVLPVLDQLWSKLQETLGPALQQLGATVQGLMNGPTGAALRGLLEILGQLVAAFLKTFGQYTIQLVTAFVQIVTGTLKQIDTAVRLIAALFRGDWARAWELFKQLGTNAINTFIKVMTTLEPNAVAAIRAMVQGIQNWLGGRFAAIMDGARKKIDEVKEGFRDIYDKVVGNSYIPDMVTEIGVWMRRLDNEMVQPAKNASAKTKETFERLRSDVASVLEGLLTDAERKSRDIANKMATLNDALRAGVIDRGTYEDATRRIEQSQIERADPIRVDGELRRPWEEAAEAFKRQQEEQEAEWQNSLRRMGNYFRGAFQEWIGTGKLNWRRLLSDMLNDWQGTVSMLQRIGGIFKNIGSGGTSGGGILGTIGSIAKGVGSIFGFGGGRAFGGGVKPGMAYTVGEHGPEKFVPGVAGTIVPNGAQHTARGGSTVIVYADNAVLADTVKGWVRDALVYADQVGQQAVRTATDLIPVEQNRKAESSFI